MPAPNLLVGEQRPAFPCCLSLGQSSTNSLGHCRHTPSPPRGDSEPDRSCPSRIALRTLHPRSRHKVGPPSPYSHGSGIRRCCHLELGPRRYSRTLEPLPLHG